VVFRTPSAALFPSKMGTTNSMAGSRSGCCHDGSASHHSRMLAGISGLGTPLLVLGFVAAVLAMRWCCEAGAKRAGLTSLRTSSPRRLEEERRNRQRSEDEAARRRDRRLQAQQFLELQRVRNGRQGYGDIEAPPTALDVREIKERYGKALEQSQRQTVLEACRISKGDPPPLCDDDADLPRMGIAIKRNGIDPEEDEDEEEPMDVVSLETVRQLDPSSEAFSHPSDAVANKNQSYIFHPSSREGEGASNRVVGGTCMICLDEMKTGDTVVWSETESCPHVYHKDCLVSFLAHNCKQQSKLPQAKQKKDCNPCPACRQQFVTLSCPVVPANNNNNN